MLINLLEKLAYCPSSPSGLVWVSGKNAGCVAGTRDPKGYWVLGVKGTSYAAARLVWELCRGVIPPGMQIDHIDRNPGNNNVNNLRLCTPGQNCINRKSRQNKHSSGLRRCPRTGRYQVRLSIDGVRKSFGYYESIDEARKVRDALRKIHYGEFSGGCDVN